MMVHESIHDGLYVDGHRHHLKHKDVLRGYLRILTDSLKTRVPNWLVLESLQIDQLQD